ncbi:MAG: hypothetical protein H0X61_14040 [Acidimicrobiia bacterium]|nr:hypothetical protein [Acidimicrobiia bacterium]MBA3984634.1 hypothetical protein [Acidimicrobiia bacterium]
MSTLCSSTLCTPVRVSLSVFAVVVHLCRAPPLEGRDEFGVRGAEGDPGAIGQIVVPDLDVRSAGLEFSEAWHLTSVDLGWVTEVAGLEAIRFLNEVCPDQLDLLYIIRVVRHDILDQPALCGREPMGRPVEVERHDLRAPGGD